MGAVMPLIGAITSIGSSLMGSSSGSGTTESYTEPADPLETTSSLKSAKTATETSSGSKTAALQGLRISRSLGSTDTDSGLNI